MLGLFGVALAVPSTATVEEAPSEELRNPPEVRAAQGVAKVRLEARLETVEVGGRRVRTMVYNGLYAPPTIRVAPGEVIELDLVNSLQEVGQNSNLHFHGLNVSPLGDSDNVFRLVKPGETARYRLALPADHPTGMFWYHSHMHQYARWQVWAGMSGGLVVEGLLEPFPTLRGITDRVMLLKDLRPWPGGRLPNDIVTNDPALHTINGQLNPLIRIRPGETQLWRLANVGPDQYYRLRLDGHDFWVIARDGNRVTRLSRQRELLIGPSARFEVLVQGGPAGRHTLHMESARTGPQGDAYQNARRRFSRANIGLQKLPLATVVSEGSPQTPVDLAALRPPPVRDLRAEPVSQRRTFVFSETADGNTFFINGNYFDINRVDTRVNLGAVEEWTIRNISGELHIFHIHQGDFQVTQVNGKPVEFLGHQDTVDLPIKGEVKFLIPFTDPILVGKYVYHCHILEHEDAGMMAVIQVVDPKNPGASGHDHLRHGDAAAARQGTPGQAVPAHGEPSHAHHGVAGAPVGDARP
jgi:FtsP/CotA-like multicopper oxidase with cupredoxin domain